MSETVYIGAGNAQVAITIDLRGNITLRQDDGAVPMIIYVEAADADEFREAVSA